jgi:hypothetical protein
MLPRVFALLVASPAVLELAGGSAADLRVMRHGEAGQGVQRPYVTWSAPGGAPENAFDGACADNFRVHVDCWSDDDTEVETLAEAVRDALEPAAHCVGYIADERNFETQRFRIGMAFDFITAR